MRLQSLWEIAFFSPPKVEQVIRTSHQYGNALTGVRQENEEEKIER